MPAWVGVQHFFNLFLLIVHHPVRGADPQPTIRACTGPGTPRRAQEWFRDPEARAGRPAVDGQAGLDQPAQAHRTARAAALDRAGSLVAPGVDMLWLRTGSCSTCCCSQPGSGGVSSPRAWTVFPNAASVLIQYLSLNWPTENGWAAYNGLQQLAYFLTVFVAAPLALAHRASACRPRCRPGSSESAGS